MRVILLGPQRRPTVDSVVRSLALAGPFVTVTAGWQEREPDDAELSALLGGRDVNVELYRRWLDVLERDPEYAAAESALQGVLAEMADLYLLRLNYALQAVYALQRRPAGAAAGGAAEAIAEAIAAVRELDAAQLRRVNEVRGEFFDRMAPHARPVIAEHRARGGQRERINDPLNPRLARSPVGDSSVCYAFGHVIPDWTAFDPEARPGSLVDMVVPSRALRRDARVSVYLPARFGRSARYPLLIVHDGGDYLSFANAKTVLDNLIHRLDVAGLVAAFVYPGDRLTEYANSAAHARYLTAELLPRLEAELPLVAKPGGRCLMGSSFGAVASLAAAYRYPDVYGSLLLQSGSFVFTDIGDNLDGGPAFEPVVRFMNRYRAKPRRVADRLFISCGVYEPLIIPNRSMVPVFEAPPWRSITSRRATGTAGRTGATGCRPGCRGSSRVRRSFTTSESGGLRSLTSSKCANGGFPSGCGSRSP